MIKSSYVKSRQQYKVTFEVSAEAIGEKRDVRVLGTFNDWSWDDGVVLMEGKKTYKGNTHLPAGDHQFRYLADDQEWINDDSAEAYTASGHGSTNCCISLKAVPTPTAKKATPKNAAPKKSAKPATKKAIAERAVAGMKDDLKRIEGIGPKIAGLLNDAGISTFSELAAATKGKLADVLQEAGARFRLAKPDTWQEQAKLAADGKDDELKKLQDELKGGVRK